jgi:uncharacterized glyoxalase superfamily protein PhnB
MTDVYPLAQVYLVVSDLERSRTFYSGSADVSDRESVDRLHAELTAAGRASRQEPFDAFFGSRYAVVEDPDGNLVGLKSPR